MRGQLLLDRRVVDKRVRVVLAGELGGEVEHVHQQACALHVGEELVAEAGAVARALDQPRNVGHDQLALVGFEHSQHRLQRRERIGGDLRRRARETRQQRGLTRVGQAHEADVGEQSQPQRQPPLLARQAALGEARRLTRGGGEALVALAP